MSRVQAHGNRRDRFSVLAGRAEQLQRLIDLFPPANRGVGRSVLVHGGAGSGKTALIDAFRRSVADANPTILTGYAYDMAARTPYAPWQQLALSFQGTGHGCDAPASMAAFQRVGSIDSTAAAVETVRACVADLTDCGPLVLILEDMHWADRESLILLEQLAVEIEALGTLLIVSYRSDELTRRDPLYQLVPVLVRDYGAAAIETPLLSRDDIQEFVEQIYRFGPDDRDRLAAFLDESTDGNPFYLHEMLRSLEQDNRIAERDGRWQLADLTGVPVSGLVRKIVALRLNELSESERRLLLAAAVIDREFSLSCWSAVTGASEKELVAVIEHASRLNLIDPLDSRGAVRFSRSLIREALYNELVLTTRRRWHRRAADVLMTFDNPKPEHIAFHLDRAGDARAAELFIEAGDRAVSARSLLQAAAYFEAALTWVEADPGRYAHAGWLHWRLAEAYRYSGPRTGIEHLDMAAEIAAREADQSLAIIAQWSRGRLLAFAGEDGLPDIVEACSRIDALPTVERKALLDRVFDDVGAIDGALVQWLAMCGRYQEALRAGEAFLERVPWLPELDGIHANTWYGIAFAATALGRPDDARPAFEEAARQHALRRDYIQVGSAYLSRIFELERIFAPENREEISRLAEAAEAAWKKANNRQARIQPAIARVHPLILDGRWDEAAELCLDQFKRDLWDVGPLTALATLSYRRGDGQNVHRLIRRVLPAGPATPPSGYWFSQSLELQRIAARQAMDEGDLPLAREWVAAHDRWMCWSNRVVGRSEHAILEAHLALAEDNLSAASDLAALARRRAREPRQPVALLDALRVSRLLAQSAGDLGSARRFLDEASQLADEIDVPYESGLTELARCELEISAGNLSQAGRSLRIARSLLGPLEAHPALEHAAQLRVRITQAGERVSLTKRETEVLQLVATGMTNRDIAEKLFISTRTVSHHLSSIYSKFGVNSRTSAVNKAVAQGLV